MLNTLFSKLKPSLLHNNNTKKLFLIWEVASLFVVTTLTISVLLLGFLSGGLLKVILIAVTKVNIVTIDQAIDNASKSMDILNY